MNSTRLPLSLVVLLATTTTSVCAQSALDPYEHIKAPAPAKKAAATAAADESVQEKTYISMPMGESAEDGVDGKKGKFGFMPKVKMPNMGGLGDKFKSAGSAVAEKTKDMSSGIANGAKASGGFMTKPFKGGDKTKVATKQEGWSKGSKSAGRAASVEDLYVQDTKRQIAIKESHKKPKESKQPATKTDGAAKGGKSITESTLASMKGAGAATKKLFAPLGKLKPKSNDESETRPGSGFYEGALAKQDQMQSEKQQVAAEQAAAKTAAAPTGSAEAVPAAKKSKYGMGMLTKLKAPSIPFMGKKDGTKVASKRAQVLDPAADAAPATSVLDPTTATAAKPAAPAAKVAAEPAAKPAGPGTMAKMTQKMNGSFAAMGGGLAKINPFKKKGIAAPPGSAAPANQQLTGAEQKPAL